MRVCKDCGEEKPVEDFPVAKGYAGGRQPRCTPCHRLFRTGLRKRHDPASVFNSKIKHQYGITLDDYNLMLSNQQGNCLICTEAMEPPHIDHCHETGKVRGLLCKHCNTGLGHFKDNVDNLGRAIAYLRRA